MPYSAADESFTHQLPVTFDQVHEPDPSWSDRCYFFAAALDGSLLLSSGYGNNPNTGTGLGYVKVSMADGRHWDLLAGRPVTGDDRGELSAGPMRWTCIEPLKKWRLDVEPNASGIAWELYYEPTAPMWELLPMKVHAENGEQLADMYHMKEPGRWTGWVEIDGERISVDGFHGGRDRTFGVRVADKIDFWLWLDAGFEDCAIEAWIIESANGATLYVDGGITHYDGTLSKRFVKIEHDVEFDGTRKRPARAALVFTDEDGKTYRVTADTPTQAVNAYYGLPMSHCQYEDLGPGVAGGYFIHFGWNSNDSAQLTETEDKSMALDQLMRFEMDGRTGWGIFELLMGGQGYRRYPNWAAMDMSAFTQGKTPTERSLEAWLGAQIPDADEVLVEGLDRVDFGHSADMMAFTVVECRGAGKIRREVILRQRPEPPALLEPYDLPRQFEILRTLAGTDVRVPPVLWLEETGDVLGRPFLVMERVGGDVFEMEAPSGVPDATVVRMCQSLVEQIAAIHAVDLSATGLQTLDTGGHLDREIDHWAAEMQRVKRGSLPALERLLTELRATKPLPHPTVTLVHGDAKPGNFAFVDGEVSAVFDWEMTTIGDPLTDLGWLELLWMQPVGITSHPAALGIDEMLAHYEKVSGITVANRPWYRAFNAFKMAVICLIGAMLYDEGHSNDEKLLLAAYGTGLLTKVGLGELGVTEELDDGPVLPRQALQK